MGSSSAGDYEVFLSFRGADTRQGFTDVLYDYLNNANIRVFRDDNALRIGDKIDSIFEFIVNSKICIPIFSPNFVQSKYCLLEVTKMVELKKTIVPIFYNVTSDDVKLKTPLYVNDLQKLEEMYGKHDVDKWKEALKQAVSYKGRKVGVKGYSQFCKEFVVEVLSKLRLRDLEKDQSEGDANGESLHMGGLSSREAISDETTPSGIAAGPVTVVGREFVATHPVELIFRKTGFVNFDVTDSNGTIIFTLNYRFLKFRVELLDASSKILVSMQQKVYRWSFDIRAFRGTNSKDFLFKMKLPKGADHMKTNSKFKHYVYLERNYDDYVWDYRVEGCWSENTCVIYAGNTNNIVAQIMPNEGTDQTAMIGKDHFVVKVYPNIDYAFIVALFESSGCLNMFE